MPEREVTLDEFIEHVQKMYAGETREIAMIEFDQETYMVDMGQEIHTGHRNFDCYYVVDFGTPSVPRIRVRQKHSDGMVHSTPEAIEKDVALLRSRENPRCFIGGKLRKMWMQP
jgi:hypothetical protein